jgi:hypothetical protein
MADLAKKLTAEQRGIFLTEMLSFILAQNGKAKVHEIKQHLLTFQDDETANTLVNSLSYLSVQAEWIKKSGNWSLTNHGKYALETFTPPKILFQTLLIQSHFRIFKTTSFDRKVLLFSAVGLQILCLVISLVSFSKIQFHATQLCLLGVTICSVFSDILLSNRRDKLMLVGRFFRIETIALFATFVADMFLTLSSYKVYSLNFFGISLLVQVFAWFLVWKYPFFVSRISQTPIIQNCLFWIIGPLLLSLLFGGWSFPRFKGLIYYIYGFDASLLCWVIMLILFTFFGILFVTGGWLFQLKRSGYFD